MLIGIDARLVPGAFGGVEQYVLGLVNAITRLPDGEERYLLLIGQDQRGWIEPYVGPRGQILTTSAPVATTSRGARLRRTVAQRLPAARAAWRRLGNVMPEPPTRLPRSEGVLERAGARLVHFPTQGAFVTELPSVYQPWDLQHEHLPELFSPSVRRWRNATYRAFCERAALVVTASRWVKQDVCVRYGIPADRISVVNVPPPVDIYPAATAAEVQEVRIRYDLPARYLFYPAQTWPHKNHLGLIAALSQLKRRGHHIPVICSGGLTDEHVALMRAARRQGVSEMLRFVGFVPPVDVRPLYELSEGMIFPSLFEGWGFPVVEAFRLGVPVACSSVTSLPDLVDGAAILFEPTDPYGIAEAMLSLWSDPELRDRLRKAGQELISGLTWEATARRMRAHYRRLLDVTLDVEEERLLAEPGLA